MKILFIVLGAVFFLGLLATAGAVYVGYRAKQKITQVAREYGLGGGESKAESLPASAWVPPTGNGCPVLPWREASEALGVAWQKVESSNSSDGTEGCRFYVTPEERQRLAKAQIAAGIHQVDKSGKNEKAGEEGVYGVARGAFNVFQNAVDGSNTDPFMELQLLRQGGKEKWDTVKSVQEGVQSALPGASQAGFGMQPVDGVGDKAYVLPASVSITV